MSQKTSSHGESQTGLWTITQEHSDVQMSGQIEKYGLIADVCVLGKDPQLPGKQPRLQGFNVNSQT